MYKIWDGLTDQIRAHSCTNARTLDPNSHRIGGYTKVIQGQSVAVELGFGPKSPYLVARPDRRALGYFYSPYAPDKPPFKITQVPADGLVKCP